jgi:peptidylprolyl isomerase/FKBP-type peptidyl-prolyl cis-trans isomerase SlyD
MEDDAKKEEKSNNVRKINPIYIVGIAIAVIALVIVVALALSSLANPVVVNGDNVSVYYIGRFTNGTIFNTNVGSAPFNFTVGAGQSMVIPVPLKYFANQTVKVGMIVSPPNGPQGEVIAVNNTTATVNFNPPLAGKTLVFTIKLVAIKR